jgi:redox-sensitive bicupin YhaK (pirin superfamily)
VWHGGGLGKSGRTRGFQLWVALPPELELAPSVSLYQGPEVIQHEGPARVLLGSYGSATSAVEAPSPINYLAVRLKQGERWSYQPPAGHTVLWVAVGSGAVAVPAELRQGDLAAFEPSNDAIEFEAQSDAEFVVGSAVRHDHELVLGYYSVHTSATALREGEARISAIRARLVQEGRL